MIELVLAIVLAYGGSTESAVFSQCSEQSGTEQSDVIECVVVETTNAITGKPLVIKVKKDPLNNTFSVEP